MQTKPRLLANLLAKLTRTNPNGGHGGGCPSASFQGQGPGNTLGRGSCLGSASTLRDPGLVDYETNETNETNMRLMRLI